MKECKFETFIYGNIWVRRMLLEKGAIKKAHVHKFDHIHVVTKGKVDIYINDQFIKTLEAGDFIKVPANQQHKVVAVEDSVAMCMQAFRTKDLEEVVATDFNDPTWVEPKRTKMAL